MIQSKMIRFSFPCSWIGSETTSRRPFDASPRSRGCLSPYRDGGDSSHPYSFDFIYALLQANLRRAPTLGLSPSLPQQQGSRHSPLQQQCLPEHPEGIYAHPMSNGHGEPLSKGPSLHLRWLTLASPGSICTPVALLQAPPPLPSATWVHSRSPSNDLQLASVHPQGEPNPP